MSQPSLFSADLAEPDVADLGGLLAAHGQLAVGADGARLSILLDEPWRAEALVAAFVSRGIAAESLYDVPLAASPGAPGPGEMAPAPRGDVVLVRSERTALLRMLAGRWTKGSVKAVPEGVVITAGLLRIWAIAAGRDTAAGYELGLDPHAVGTFDPLRAALGRAGIAASVVGRQSAAPVLRVTGAKRRLRLAEMIGDVPPAAAVA